MSAKPDIRNVLRKIYDEAGANPPNINDACHLVMGQIPASRSRIREVLKEDEFARRRRGPGRKAKHRPIQPTTGQEIPVAIRIRAPSGEDGTPGCRFIGRGHTETPSSEKTP